MKTKLLVLVIWMISLKNFAQNTYSTIGVYYLQNQPQTQLNPEDWHYIAVTKSGLNGNVYIDGVLASSSTYANVPYIWNSLLLGASQACVSCTPVPLYLGLIDEVRISNTVRTATEIQNNYNSNSPLASDANTLGLFHFDSNTGTSITNSAGGNNGVLFGGVSFGTGKFGLGLSFDGVDDYSRISQSIPVNNMTLEFWYKSSDNDAVIAMMELAYNTGISLSTSSISCQVPTGTLADGMVAYYPFCGNANDESVNGNNGTVNGATLTTDRFGNTNSAYSFNGVNNNIQVSNPILPQGNSSRTFSAWFYLTPTTGYNDWYSILSYGNGLGDGFLNDILIMSTIADYNCSTFFAMTNQLNDLSNNWHNIVVTYDSSNLSNIKIYIDSVLMQTNLPNNISIASLNTQITSMYFGKSNELYASYYYFNGKIDDIGIWNRALSQQEVTNLYNNNLSTNSFENTESLITIYPNPTNSLINIDSSNKSDTLRSEIKIYNTLGQEIYHSRLNEKVEKISLGSIATSGFYIIHITDRNGKTISTKKVLLQ